MHEGEMAGDSELDGDGAKVLIADPDRRVRQALRALLQTDTRLAVAGEAGSVDELFHLAAESQSAVILLDVLLPEAGDGLRAITHVTRDSNSRILVLTNGMRWRDAALRAGAAAVLDKGTDADSVLRAVSRLAYEATD